jgi:hypothetical protein
VTAGLVTQVRRAGRSDARVMAMMRYASRTELVFWPSPRSVSLYARHGFRRQGEVMELHRTAESSPELRLAAEPVSLPVTRLGP